MVLAGRGVDLLDPAEHALVEHLVQPAQRLGLEVVVGDRGVGFRLGRVLAEEAPVLAEVEIGLALVGGGRGETQREGVEI